LQWVIWLAYHHKKFMKSPFPKTIYIVLFHTYTVLHGLK
jgi:hypothetical protein